MTGPPLGGSQSCVGVHNMINNKNFDDVVGCVASYTVTIDGTPSALDIAIYRHSPRRLPAISPHLICKSNKTARDAIC